MNSLIVVIRLFAQLLIYILFAQAVLSWFVRQPYGTLWKIYEFLSKITAPLCAPFKKIRINTQGGSLDFSLFFAMIAIIILERILIRILILV